MWHNITSVCRKGNIVNNLKQFIVYKVKELECSFELIQSWGVNGCWLRLSHNLITDGKMNIDEIQSSFELVAMMVLSM